MAVDWDAEVLAPCMSADVFGQGVIYTPKSGAGAFQLDDAVFDDAYRSLTLLGDGDPGLSTTDPRLGVRLAEFDAEPVQGDKVQILATGVVYLVMNVQPDGKGHAVLELNVAKVQS